MFRGKELFEKSFLPKSYVLMRTYEITFQKIVFCRNHRKYQYFEKNPFFEITSWKPFLAKIAVYINFSRKRTLFVIENFLEHFLKDRFEHTFQVNVRFFKIAYWNIWDHFLKIVFCTYIFENLNISLFEKSFFTDIFVNINISRKSTYF